MAMEDAAADLAAEFGGPGPEDMANGAAALAAGLLAQAHTLAGTAAALEASDAGHQGAIDAAAARAALALAMAQAVSEAAGQARPGLIRAAAQTLGVSLGGAVTQLRAAALALPTDDAAARIAAAQIAGEIAAGLG
ncbi:hypothetical protein CR162_11085 [Pseudoroseomonas rhizosphaerae]|uniref:Cyclodeaminase/cyclohydrolase domain-containing protein n=1 Tax=Teichococcus rhizosphaerae TaxID=1335062 RepID=A0A2C7AAB2_9PROT|nr:hypothetical protein [Pseudoroseomonas rhizosphaerae]PHK94969.1 hypothetical protein CR162_11085 [Pseudoroseomonas rhizosphaerae]